MKSEITGNELYKLVTRLFPICRSITGDGVRETLKILQELIPLDIKEIATGTKVFDWTVPREWNIRDAYIKDPNGRRIVDFRESNLHVVSYSKPVKRKISYAELEKHLFSLPDKPDWIPYRTSYYKEDWGFCLSHKQLKQLDKDGDYEVYIDSTLEDGHLSYGEYLLKGETAEEVLLSCHVCHPSLCNDNLSSISILAYLAHHLSKQPLRYSYRFLFIPVTIGSITWLSLNEKQISNIKHGLVAACLGDAGNSTYKRSRRGNAEIDHAVECVLQDSGSDYVIDDFTPYGYDERQFCSPGFNLPVGSLMRTPNGCYPQYHTSADNLELVAPEYLADSFYKYLAVVNVLENNKTFHNTNPKCEPQLGKRGLYDAMANQSGDKQKLQLAILWTLNMSDGNNSLLDIAIHSKVDFLSILSAANMLLKHRLLTPSAK